MQSHLRNAEMAAHLLDSKFSIFGFKFGVNAIFDLIPELGDAVAALLSLYLVWIGIQMGLPAYRLAQMVGNILINFIIGSIPILGDAVYIFHKANLKNLEILKQYSNNYA